MRPESKTSNSNIQAPEKNQSPNFKQASDRAQFFGAWNLEVIWMLELGCWSFLTKRVSLIALLLLTGCATTPRTQIQRAPNSFPADALITQRGVLTVFTPLGRRQFTLNGYLAISSTNGQRLVVTENFGSVLADVIVKPDGKAYVMRSSRAFKPNWIERFIAADVRCIFGNSQQTDCPGRMIAPNHFLIERRWYKLDLHIVETKPGLQPPEMFVITKAEKH